MRAGREVHVAHRMLQELRPFGIELTMLPDQTRGHCSVGVHASVLLEALGLYVACLFNANANGC